jgi:hypothetical protein
MSITEPHLQILRRPFPETDIAFDRPRQDGFKPQYIPWDKIAERLDEAFKGNWSFEIVKQELINGSMWLVHGRLTAYGLVKDGIGTWDVEKNQHGQPTDPGSNLKSACSDALKRCAVLFGVGIQLYQREGQRNNLQQQAEVTQVEQTDQPAQPFQISSLRQMLVGLGCSESKFLECFNINGFDQLTSGVVVSLLSGTHPFLSWFKGNAAPAASGLKATNA